MPKPSASRPAQRSRQHIANTSAHAYSAGEVVFGDATEKADVRASPRCAFLEPIAVATAAADREVARRGASRDGVDHDVESLAGHEARQPEHERAVGIETEALAGQDARLRRRPDGTARRRHPEGSRPRPPVVARDTRRLVRGIAARGNDRGARRARRAERADARRTCAAAP